jgi:Predicted nucleic-acid-binding protein containing a Zn-ribbon
MALENKFSEVAENKLYSLAYHKALGGKRLIGSKCKKCGHVSIPPRPICLKCYGNEMESVEMKGKGKLAAYTVIGVGTPFMIEEGFDREHPYCSGVVELEEGTKITARILGVDIANPDKIKIGTPVTVEYVEAMHDGEKKTFLAFRVLP